MMTVFDRYAECRLLPAPIAKEKEMPRQGIEIKELAHERCEAINQATPIRGARGDRDPHRRRDRLHVRSATRIVRKRSTEAPARTVRRSPPASTTSMLPSISVRGSDTKVYRRKGRRSGGRGLSADAPLPVVEGRQRDAMSLRKSCARFRPLLPLAHERHHFASTQITRHSTSAGMVEYQHIGFKTVLVERVPGADWHRPAR